MAEPQASVCARPFATEWEPTVRETLVDEGDGERDFRKSPERSLGGLI